MQSHALNITEATDKGSRILKYFFVVETFEPQDQKYFANFFLQKGNVEQMAGFRLKIDEAGGRWLGSSLLN